MTTFFLIFQGNLLRFLRDCDPSQDEPTDIVSVEDLHLLCIQVAKVITYLAERNVFIAPLLAEDIELTGEREPRLAYIRSYTGGHATLDEGDENVKRWVRRLFY